MVENITIDTRKTKKKFLMEYLIRSPNYKMKMGKAIRNYYTPFLCCYQVVFYDEKTLICKFLDFPIHRNAIRAYPVHMLFYHFHVIGMALVCLQILF